MLAGVTTLAVAGAFGMSRSELRASSGTIEVSGRAARTLRYGQLGSIELRVRNRSERLLDTVRVALDTALAARFTGVAATPPMDRPYVVSLAALAPGETRLVVIELDTERYGLHTGSLTITARDTLTIPLSIRILP